MAKDIAKVREEEAQKERERIANFKKEPKLPKKPQVVLSQHPEGKPTALSSGSAGPLPTQNTRPGQAVDSAKQFTPAPPSKQPLIARRSLKRSEKLFIRLVVGGIILFLIFNTIAFGFWYFFQRDTQQKPGSQNIQQELQDPALLPVAPQPQPKDSSESALDESNEDQASDKTPSPAPEPSPIPIIDISSYPFVETLETSSSQLLSTLQEFLNSKPGLGLTVLLLQDETTGVLLSTEEFLQAARLAFPQGLKDRFGQDFVLFSYIAGGKNRLSLIFELTETQGTEDLLLSFEPAMEQGFASFFEVIGRKGSAYSPVFRSVVYKGVQVRFQTFSVIDFGIVYGIMGNNLVLTSSLESFQKTIDLLTELP